MALAVLAFPISTAHTVEALTYNELKAYTEKQAEREWSNQLTAHARTLVGKRTGQCVTSLRTYFGVPKGQMGSWAKYTRPNTKTPTVGSIIILNMSMYGHVGIVLRVDGNIITYFDSNGDWKQRGAIRTIINGDRRIAGFRIVK